MQGPMQGLIEPSLHCPWFGRVGCLDSHYAKQGENEGLLYFVANEAIIF